MIGKELFDHLKPQIEAAYERVNGTKIFSMHYEGKYRMVIAQFSETSPVTQLAVSDLQYMLNNLNLQIAGIERKEKRFADFKSRYEAAFLKVNQITVEVRFEKGKILFYSNDKDSGMRLTMPEFEEATKMLEIVVNGIATETIEGNKLLSAQQANTIAKKP